MNQIILSISKDAWMATFVGPHAASIKRLFNTDTIPLPFTPQADPEIVRKDVQDRNPDCQVVMA